MPLRLHLPLIRLLSIVFLVVQNFDTSRTSVICPEECYRESRVKAYLKAQGEFLQGECPCVKPAGSDSCLSYDSRLQATTIEEALYEFPDFVNYATGNKPLVEKEPTPPLLGSSGRGRIGAAKASASRKTEGYGCYSIECQSCKAMVINSFVENAGVNITTPKPRINSSYCEQKRSYELGLAKTSNAVIVNTTEPSPIVSKIVDLLEPKKRKKREESKSDASDVKLLGVATKIGCDYKRGEEIASGWSGLCNLCWQWRKLPEDYFPTFLNEVACDDSDKGCLAAIISRLISFYLEVCTKGLGFVTVFSSFQEEKKNNGKEEAEEVGFEK
ncbi:unnamed protein product [Enterobius vermicularis]|uniref:Uncharacterized protein n=1 Tax=Enterobius vermicularis TaxID=51028 RepID=A0A0N4VIP4_ENTVE|nr:unnamed protein product [Enterobius vermicularis]